MELENFLVNTLMEKEISKLLASTLQSYQGIEKLISRNLMCCCYLLATHLQTLLGMSRWYDRYEVMGLNEATVQNSINKLTGLMVKAQELLQCISLSKAKLGAFLKWLLKATISLSDGKVCSVRLTDQEMNLVIKFLKTGSLFATRADSNHFNIDTVWQYFSDDDITVPPEYYNNKILDTVLTLLKDKKPHLAVQPTLSLVQSRKLFTESLLRCFSLSLPGLDTPLHTVEITSLYSLSCDSRSLRFVDENNIITMVSLEKDGLEIISQNRHIISDKITRIFGYDRDFILVTESNEDSHTLCICFEDDMVKTELPPGFGEIYISENRRLGAIVSALGRRIQIMDLDEESGDE